MSIYSNLHSIFEEYEKLFVKKQADYGMGNISRHGVQGVLVRLDDKLERLNNILKKGGETQVKDETLRDTAIDILGYSAILNLLIRDEWK